KRVRVAQYKPHRARIVVETAGRANYNASLVLNPPRLVIDIHRDESQAESDSADTVSETKPASNAGQNKIVAAAQRSPEKVVELPGVPTAPKKVIVEADDDDSAADELEQNPPSSSSKHVKPEGQSKSKRTQVASRSMHESEPTSSGDRSLIRTLGLRI